MTAAVAKVEAVWAEAARAAVTTAVAESVAASTAAAVWAVAARVEVG